MTDRNQERQRNISKKKKIKNQCRCDGCKIVEFHAIIFAGNCSAGATTAKFSFIFLFFFGVFMPLYNEHKRTSGNLRCENTNKSKEECDFKV